MIKYLIGTVVGGLFGYFVLHKVVGCSTGTCPITTNPYLSILYGIIIGVLVAGIINFPATPKAQAPAAAYVKITAKEAKARMDSGDEIIIVDVRTEAEYELEHIANAILIPNETIVETKPALLPDLNAEILVYCRSGNRSAQATRKLLAMGYTNVYDFGGIIDWPYDTITK